LVSDVNGVGTVASEVFDQALHAFTNDNGSTVSSATSQFCTYSESFVRGIFEMTVALLYEYQYFHVQLPFP
jgi:hypothetical protein